ncbi:MAG TPA: ABC transporter substrate-binding protein [Desulfobacteraceae bacterium]|nr:ABC transporter substrate-binding protein [Desulfobacteraceae bacterium]
MTTVRIGMVNYINTAPIYEEWKTLDLDPGWRATTAPPSTLNRMLANDELDLGMVSCYEYAVRPDRYRILADLSISANGPVGSVFLFSTVPPDELSGRLVLLTSQSATSVALVKIVLEEFYGIKPRYAVGDIMADGGGSEVSGILAIGDDALRLNIHPIHPYRLDLAGVWREYTGLPFVFSVFVVREEFARTRPETLEEVRQTLIGCRERGHERLREICALVASRIPMEIDACHAYLQQIQHLLDPAHRRGLERFFGYLIERGEANAGALPLKLFPGPPPSPPPGTD